MFKASKEFFQENAKRYRTLISGKVPDYAPFRLWLDNYFVCKTAGIDPADYARNFEVCFNAQKVVHERFYEVPEFVVPAGHGDIFFNPDMFTDPPKTRHILEDLATFDKIKPQENFMDIPSICRLFEVIEFFNKKLPKGKKVYYYFGTPGAFDLYSTYRGTEAMFLDLYDNPRYVHRIFTYLTERSLEWLDFARKKWEQLGMENGILFDKLDIGEDYCAYVPPDLFDEFVKPYTGRLMEANKDKLRSLHSDGDFHLENLAKLNKLGIDEFMGFSPNIDIKDVRRVLPDIILAGNIHPIKVMNEGTPEDVKNTVRYCFKHGAKNGRFVLCTGGAIGYGAKPENIDAFLESVYEICKY